MYGKFFFNLCQQMEKNNKQAWCNLQNICITGPRAISIVSGGDTSVLAAAKAEKTVRTLLHKCTSCTGTAAKAGKCIAISNVRLLSSGLNV